MSKKKEQDMDVPKTVFFFGKNKKVYMDNNPYTLKCGKNMSVEIQDDGAGGPYLRYRIEAFIRYESDFTIECFKDGNNLQAAATALENELLKGMHLYTRLLRGL